MSRRMIAHAARARRHQAAQPAADAVGPVASGVTVDNVGPSSARVTWDLSEPATGWVEYGLTTGYGSETTRELTLGYSHHAQTISGLAAGTLYHYRVRGADGAGNAYTGTDGTFTTSASVAPPVALFGGIAMQTLNNFRIGWGGITHGSQAFVAERSLVVTSIRIYGQGGSGYGAGTGGIYDCRIYPDDGSGQPNLNATPLASVSGVSGWAGSSGNTPGKLITFAGGGTALVAGTVYHFVMIHTGSTANYTSMNCIRNPSASPPFQRWPNALHHRFQYRQNGTWNVVAAHVLVHEVKYSDGWSHGNGYMEIGFQGTIPSIVGQIQASSNRMVRQSFVMVGNADALSAGVCLQKASGSTGALTLALRASGAGRGTLLDSFAIAASAVPTGSMDGLDYGSSKDWVGGEFPTTPAVTNGTTYRLEASTTGNSDFRIWPIRNGSRAGYGYSADMAGLWPTGQVQYSTDGGANWSNFSGNDDDLPAWLEVG
jgi:hypothetical protein